MEKPIKRGRGRPPGSGANQIIRRNQYTGQRAEHIDYVRKALRHFLDRFAPDFVYHTAIKDVGSITGREKIAAVAYFTQYLTACRLLLLIENVQLYAIPQASNAKKVVQIRERLLQLGEGIKTGSVNKHSLLSELDSINEGFEDADAS